MVVVNRGILNGKRFKNVYKTKICQKSDFKDAEEYFDRLNNVQSNSLICIDDLTKIFLAGDKENQAKDFSIFNFRMRKCKGKPYCETD